ncbi:SWIM zinc finger family protein [Leptolyngbya sp. PCC 6406]|uniref:SWIM zinc finger family protein n=1 Tax=Leptolyngbya sp. PCC 6406 TaxID=1173264 RepID=UPI0002ABF144|nr:SWIM zinc finger family protein [Leptolyngbya sp. PCC 6406]
MTSYQTPADYELEQEAWWVQRWVDLLNQYRFKKRLERGRRYAREGNILDLQYKNSKVVALVQGTAPEPYQLSIWLDAFADEDWDYVIDTLSQQAIFSAQLLAGDMPSDIEAVFTRNGLSLFPFTLSDVHSRCSCPDPKNPCKHIAAVYYQLGDFFREDPFVLFQLRGRSRDQILEALRQKRQQQMAGAQTDDGAGRGSQEEEITSRTVSPEGKLSEPAEGISKTGEMAALPQIQEASGGAMAPLGRSLTSAIDRFWTYDRPLDSSLVVITPSGDTALEVLNPIPLPANDARVVTAYLRDIYQAVGQRAAMTALNPQAED